MLAQQLRESSSLFGSLDAVRHWRALLLLSVVFLLGLAMEALGGRLVASTGVWAFRYLFTGLGGVLLLWGGNAAGILMMDEVAGRTGRSVARALQAGLGATRQMVLVLLALALFYLVGLLGLTMLLLICSAPVVGPWLYAWVFPVALLAAGAALFAWPALVLPLCGPAVWCGLDASTCLAQLWAVVRRRLSLVLTWMLMLACLIAVVSAALAAVLLLGASVVGGVSAAVLGAPGLPPVTGLLSPLASLGGAQPAHAQASLMGGTVLCVAACAVPSLVAMRGACIVYKRVLLGLSTLNEEHALDQTLAVAKNRSREFKAALASKAPTQPSSAFVSIAQNEGVPSRDTWMPAAEMPAFAPQGMHPHLASSPWQSPGPCNATTSAASKVAAAIADFPAPRPLEPWVPQTNRSATAVSPQWRPAASPELDLDIDLELPLVPRAAQKPRCASCGGETEKTDLFCGHCGHALRPY